MLRKARPTPKLLFIKPRLGEPSGGGESVDLECDSRTCGEPGGVPSGEQRSGCYQGKNFGLALLAHTLEPPPFQILGTGLKCKYIQLT